MTANAPNLDHAKDLVSRELPKYLGPRFEIHHIVLGPRFEIHHIVVDTFHHDDEDLVHIFVYFKPGHPDLDPHLLIPTKCTQFANAASSLQRFQETMTPPAHAALHATC